MIPMYWLYFELYTRNRALKMVAVMKMMSLNTTPMAREKPALKPFSMLVFIIEKNTGPVRNENKTPAPIPCIIASNINLRVYDVLMCKFTLKKRFTGHALFS